MAKSVQSGEPIVLTMSRIGTQSVWFQKAAVALVATVVALGVSELAFRLLWLKRLTIPASIQDPHFHNRLAPNHTYHFTSGEFDVKIRTNRYGLRGPDPVLPKPDGTYRILMLGDSYTFGFPVEDHETFAYLTEKMLQAQGLSVEVVNGGVSSYSPTLHYISLRDQFLSFEPDLVMLWYDIGDLQEDAWFQKNLIFDDQGRILRADPHYIHGRYSWWEFAQRHSALAQYLNKKVLNTFKKMRILGLTGYIQTKLRGERSKVAIARLKRQQEADDLATYDRFLLVRESSSEAMISRYWELSARYVRMIRDLLDERGIPFVMGIYPYGMLAGPDQWGGGREYWGFESGKTYEAAPALAMFNTFAREENILLINTYESFRDAAKTRTLFYNWDGHFTPAGHEVVATHLTRDEAFLDLLRRSLPPSAGTGR